MAGDSFPFKDSRRPSYFFIIYLFAKPSITKFARYLLYSFAG